MIIDQIDTRIPISLHSWVGPPYRVGGKESGVSLEVSHVSTWLGCTIIIGERPDSSTQSLYDESNHIINVHRHIDRGINTVNSDPQRNDDTWYRYSI
jgi:hypothetical protein